MYWNPGINKNRQIKRPEKIAPYHPDMNTTGTPTLWEVKVDNRLFVQKPIVVSVQNGIRLHCPSEQVGWLSDRIRRTVRKNHSDPERK